MYFVGFFGYGVFYRYTNIAFEWGQSIEILTPKIAYPPNSKWEVDILFYKVTISMDSTKYKPYIRNIIYKLTKLKIDIRLLDFTLWFSRIKHSIAGQS